MEKGGGQNTVLWKGNGMAAETNGIVTSYLGDGKDGKRNQRRTAVLWHLDPIS